jgi:hypothetical protein
VQNRIFSVRKNTPPHKKNALQEKTAISVAKFGESIKGCEHIVYQTLYNILPSEPLRNTIKILSQIIARKARTKINFRRKTQPEPSN